MIAVGLVEGGVELDGTWVSEVGIAIVERLQLEDHPAASISLVYLIPGSITSPGFEGVRLGRIQKGPPAWLEARIGVSAAELESDRLPDLLLDMAEEAVGAAAARYERANITFDPGHMRHIAQVRKSLVTHPITRPPWPRSPTELQELVRQVDRELAAKRGRLDLTAVEQAIGEAAHGSFKQGLTLNLAMHSQRGEREELERLFAFEDELERLLHEAGDAELEGNEIGDGAFSLFIRCRSATRTWARIEPLIGDLGSMPGSHAELEGPKSTRRIDLSSSQ